jgi:hypothetical protein
MQEFSEVWAVASRHSLYQILETNTSIGTGRRAKCGSPPTPIGIGTGECGGDCYGELPRILIPRTSVNTPRICSAFIAGSSQFVTMRTWSV